ncbi:MAG: Fis family transcriptional regulator [Candidatus Omnitrophica bacterium]|nr:Fis family transcriptional regulator [Candidatus Omnitrophota bacterium]
MYAEKIGKDIDEMFFLGNKRNVYDKVITSTEKMLIEKSLERSYGNQSLAAKLLGVNRNTLRAKIKKFGIKSDRYKI